MAVSGKARIVAEDERETNGRRALLNFGHTFGHVLEAEKGFSDRLLHGEAVAAGADAGVRLLDRAWPMPRASAERVRTQLAAVGLPNTLESAASPPAANG